MTLPMVVLLAVLLTTTAVPVLAQEEPSSSGALAQPIGGPPTPNPLDFVLEEDGTVTIDGDSGASCRSFAMLREQGYYSFGDPEQARSVLEQCEQAGFLSPDEQLALTEAQPSPNTGGTLPNTGGPDLLVPVWVGVALFLAGLGVLKLAGRRSS